MIANPALYARRRVANGVFIVLSISAAIFGLIWLGFILTSLLSQGVLALSPALFTQSTPPPGMDGELDGVDPSGRPPSGDGRSEGRAPDAPFAPAANRPLHGSVP